MSIWGSFLLVLFYASSSLFASSLGTVQLRSEFPQHDGHLGFSVSTNSSTVLTGAFDEYTNGLHTGAAYLFDRSTGEQLSRLTPEQLVEDQWYGYTTAIEGNLAVVSARKDVGLVPGAGAVYLYSINDPANPWLVSKLFAPDGFSGMRFGESVDIHNGIVVIGAPWDDGGTGYRSGSVYVTNLTADQNFTKLSGAETNHEDEFGRAVAIDGDLILVGAPEEDLDGTQWDAGACYLFQASTGEQLARFLPDELEGLEHFGCAVDLCGNIAVIGDPHDRDVAFEAGAIYVYDVSSPREPLLLRKIVADDGEIHHHLGQNVAIDGDIVCAGVHSFLNSRGATYVFDVHTGQQLAKVEAPDADAFDQFGTDVAIHGDYIVGGAPGVDDDEQDVEDAGAAFVFNIYDACQLCPENDDCENATPITEGLHPYSTRLTSTDGPLEQACGFPDINGLRDDVWFRYIPSCDGVVTASVCDSDFNNSIVIYEGSCPKSDNSAMLCDEAGCGTAKASATFFADASTEYWFRIGGKNFQTGSGTLEVTCDPAPPCPGDIDSNNLVDATDLLSLLASWGDCTKPCIEDLNNDLIVDVNDLLLLLASWGPCPIH